MPAALSGAGKPDTAADIDKAKGALEAFNVTNKASEEQLKKAQDAARQYASKVDSIARRISGSDIDKKIAQMAAAVKQVGLDVRS